MHDDNKRMDIFLVLLTQEQRPIQQTINNTHFFFSITTILIHNNCFWEDNTKQKRLGQKYGNRF